MSKLPIDLKNYLLNRSNQYSYYKSQYNQLKKDMTAVQADNKKLLNRIEELEKGNFNEKKSDFQQNDDSFAAIRTKNLCKLENVSVGKYTYGNPKIVFYNQKDKLIIGDFCSIAQDVTILIGMYHCITCATTFPYPYFPGIEGQHEDHYESVCEETVIGNDVWIGYGALILSGVTIGDGAIIGARTVVSKDVEPYSIVAGSPMKHLRYRFPKEIRDTLIEKKWWDLPDEKLTELAPYIAHPDIHRLLEKLDNI